MPHGVEGNAASVVVGDQEDAGVGLYQAVHQAGHQGAVGCFPGDHLEVHPEEYLKERLVVHLLGYP